MTTEAIDTQCTYRVSDLIHAYMNPMWEQRFRKMAAEKHPMHVGASKCHPFTNKQFVGLVVRDLEGKTMQGVQPNLALDPGTPA